MKTSNLTFSKYCRSIRNQLHADIKALGSLYNGFAPKLVIVQVGSREDSSVYVRMKQQAALKVVLNCLFVELNIEIC